jgi:hypothetical protein
MAGTRSPWAIEAGEHVCWQVRSAGDYAAGEHELVSRARRAGRQVLVVGGLGAASEAGAAAATVPGPGEGASAVLEAVRRRAHAARRTGQLLWVLAAMEHLTRPNAALTEVVACELELAELATETETGIVCAYQAEQWHPGTLGDIAAVHSRVMGMNSGMSGFRLRYAGAGGYCLDGTVGYECLRAFTATLRGTLDRFTQVKLSCEHLELIDAAAWRALVETVAAVPGASVLLEHANETVLDTWRYSGYDTPAVTVRGAR